MPLSETTLLNVAGDLIFARGEGCVRNVRGLRTTAGKAYAAVQGTKVYNVELDWSGLLPDGICTCPHHADGNFCKHLVAVGLAAIDSGRVEVDDDTGAADSALEATVQAMNVDELREMLMMLAQRDDGVRRLLEVRATTASGADTPAKAEFETYVRTALELRGFIDYRESFEVARVASEVLDELESHLKLGAAEIVRPALLRAVTRLRKITGEADDSSGSIRDAGQRAANLYAEACRLGQPDSGKLAAWLVKFRADSPGWPNLVLADFVDAFDEKALASYRAAVAKLDRTLADRDHWGRFEVDAMLQELADHDGDVDRAVRLLGEREEHRQYGAIVDRLRTAGRDDDAVTWIDRAVADGRVSSHGGGNEYWLSPDDVAGTYQRLGRIDDAIAVLRADFARQPSVQNYGVLRDFAAGIDRSVTERAWAFDHAHQLASDRFAAGAVLVQLSLSEGDVGAAWEAADRYGPGWAWKELADRGAEARPVAAADLYRPQLEKDLRHPNSGLYPGIATTLATMAELYEQGGRSGDFAGFIAQIRQDYGRRPSLMKALTAKGL